MRLIGLSGLAGSGKDFIATNYFADYGYLNVSLAWHLKLEAVRDGDCTFEEAFTNPKPSHVRDVLQQRGTERGREVYGENVWIDVTFNWIKIFSDNWGFDRFVIPDVRFVNEAQAILDAGGSVYRVISDRESVSGWDAELQQHKSETELWDDHNIFTGKIYNNRHDTHEIVAKQVIHCVNNNLGV
jgi:hypothetical protein